MASFMSAAYVHNWCRYEYILSIYFLGGIVIDRLFYHIDLVSGIVVALFTFVGVAAAYVKSIELMFMVLLAQGVLETFMNMSKSMLYCMHHVNCGQWLNQVKLAEIAIHRM